MRTLLNEENFTIDNLLTPDILKALTGLGILAILPLIYKLIKKGQPNRYKNKPNNH